MPTCSQTLLWYPTAYQRVSQRTDCNVQFHFFLIRERQLTHISARATFSETQLHARHEARHFKTRRDMLRISYYVSKKELQKHWRPITSQTAEWTTVYGVALNSLPSSAGTGSWAEPGRGTRLDMWRLWVKAKTSKTRINESVTGKGKGKGAVPNAGHRRGAHLPFLGLWARRWRNHYVCDTWPVYRQTYGYLPSLRASPPFDRYQVILLGDRGT